MHIPATPTDLDAAWLTDALRHGGAIDADTTVASVVSQDIGEGTGIFGQISRLQVGYETGAGPASMIIKLPCTEPANLAVANMLNLYEREVRFFEVIAPTTPMRVPVCHLAHLGEDGRSVLLLEDLGVDFEVGDQIVGISPDDAEAVVDVLVGLHAHWWQRPELDAFEWLPKNDAPMQMAAVPGIYRAGLPVLESEWADRVPSTSIDVARRLDPLFEELMVRTGAGPLTFAHGDTRLDNIFLARGATGGRRIALIDFQLSLKARGVADVAYMVSNSMNIDDAQDNWERLLRHWHDGLADRGISDYSWDQTLNDYRESVLYYLCGAMSLIGSFDTGNERGAAMTEAYTTRVFTHVVDIDAASIL